jgi:hypothetical protein
MKTIVFAIPLVFTAAVVNAQEHTTPAVETGMNFSFTTLYPGSGVPSLTSTGGTGTVEYNLNRTFGVLADLGGYRNSSDVNFNPTTFTYLFGPRVNFRMSRITPYASPPASRIRLPGIRSLRTVLPWRMAVVWTSS